jgi:4'-phosphopantetheinyl transferase
MTTIATEWSERADAPTLPQGGVHLWRIDLDTADSSEERLSDDERVRAKRFVHERDRARFTSGRAALRAILAAYVERTPQAVEFSYSHTGRPALRSDPDALDFNLAHSENWALCAVSRGAPVGVDVERVRPLDTLLPIARRSFAPAECREVAALDSRPTEQLASFYRIWTRREAVIKGLGDGLPSAIDVTGAIPTLDEYVRARTSAAWTVLEFEPAADCAGALAIGCVDPDLHCLQYHEGFATAGR